MPGSDSYPSSMVSKSPSEILENVNIPNNNSMYYNFVNRFAIYVETDGQVNKVSESSGSSQPPQHVAFNEKMDLIDYVESQQDNLYKTYYCNPKTEGTNGYTIESGKTYEFKVYCKNDLIDDRYNISTITSNTGSVDPPSKIPVADFNQQKGGFYAEYDREIEEHTNKIILKIPTGTLKQTQDTTASIYTTASISSDNSFDADAKSVFWEKIQLNVYVANADANYDKSNDSIEWSTESINVSDYHIDTSNNVTRSENEIIFNEPIVSESI